MHNSRRASIYSTVSINTIVKQIKHHYSSTYPHNKHKLFSQQPLENNFSADKFNTENINIFIYIILLTACLWQMKMKMKTGLPYMYQNRRQLCTKSQLQQIRRRFLLPQYSKSCLNTINQTKHAKQPYSITYTHVSENSLSKWQFFRSLRIKSELEPITRHFLLQQYSGTCQSTKNVT
jgi:hypothetical protein